MALHRGIQYATVTDKVLGPMSEPAVAEKVIEKIADQMTRGLTMTQHVDGQIAQHEDAISAYEIAIESLEGDADRAADGTRTALEGIKAKIAELRAQIHALRNAPAPKAPVEIAREMVEKACGRYARGKHVGQLRGWAHLEVCTEGGWKKDGPGEGNGHVLRPGRVVAIKILDFNGKPFLEYR